MKYCKNCGMLLEDTQEICIGCGSDVSDPANTSQFPPEVAEKMESKKAQEKKKNSIVIAIVIVFILLAVLIGVIAAVASKAAAGGTSARDEIEAEVAEEEEEEVSLETAATASEEEEEVALEEEERRRDNRKVSDDLGSYYIVGEVYDDAGMLMFTTLYPEDFGGTEPEASFDYTRYSDQFPGVMSCVISDADNTMRLTYMSPEHFWFLSSSI